MSYYRGTIDDDCTPLSNTIDGDWNIRAVMSGADSESMSNKISYIPQEHRICSNYPNPFNPSTVLPIYLATPANVKLQIYDLGGHQVQIFEYQMLHSGHHKFEVLMGHMSSGIYIYRFTIDGMVQHSNKMALLK